MPEMRAGVVDGAGTGVSAGHFKPGEQVDVGGHAPALIGAHGAVNLMAEGLQRCGSVGLAAVKQRIDCARGLNDLGCRWRIHESVEALGQGTASSGRWS